jgi:peptide/nickel transport system substrate-binding protein
MFSIRKGNLWLTVLAVTLVGAAAAGPASAKSLDTVTIATHLDVDTLDPTQNINTHQRWVYRHIYDPLITHDPSGKLRPALAVRWERINDTTWRFHLRKGVKFHNGEPFTAASVKFTIARMQLKTSQARSYYSAFKDVKVIDDHTVDLITHEPLANVLSLIADYLNPVPPKYFKAVGGKKFARQPVGTGAYKLQSWRRGDRVTLEANQNWWGGTPKATKVVFWAVPEPTTRVAALLNGEADLVTTVPPIQVKRIKQSKQARVELSASGVQPIWAGIIVDRPALKDKRVRHAINYAINKKAIVDRLLLGYGKVMGQPCPYATSCYNPKLRPYSHNPEKARQLLKDAGVSNVKITLNFPTGVVPQGSRLAQAISADLAKVGIKAVLKQDEWAVFAGKLFDFKNKQARLGDTFMMYYKAGPTVERVLATVLVSDRNWNWTHYNNPKVDALWKKAETTFGRKERTKALHQMAAIVREDAPWIFLYEPLSIWGVSNRIAWKARNDDFIYVEDMSPKAR